MLPEERRQQLDGIVQQMAQNNESDANIQFVVNDFKSKYDVKQAAPKQGFLSGVNASLVKRGVNIADELTPQGNESMGATLVKAPRRAFRMLGQAAGLVGDVGGELIKSGYETLVPESTQETIKTGLNNIGNTPIGKMGINAAKSGYEAYQKFKTQYPEQAKDLEATVNIASLLPMGKATTLVKPAAAEAVNIGRDAVSLVKAGTRKVVKKAIPEDMPQKVLESGAKWSTTLSPETRKTLSKTMMEEDLNLSPKGYDKLKTTIDDINGEIKTALDPYKDTPIDANSVIERTSEAMKKAEKSYDPATETAKVNEEVGKFLDNWGGKLTVSDAQSIKQDIYKQLKSHYDSVSKGGPGKYTDGEIAAKKNIARGLKEEIENAVEDAPIKDLNARETKLLKLEPHLRRAVGRIENHNILSLDDVLAGGVGTTLGGMTGGPVGAAIGAAAAGIAKRALGHPGTKSKIANTLYGLQNSDIKLVPKSALGQKIEGVLTKQPVLDETGQTLNYAVGPVKSGVNVGEPYGPEAPRLIKQKQLPAGQGFEMQGAPYNDNVIDVPFTSRTVPQLPNTEGVRLALPAGKTIPGEDFVMREAPQQVILRKPYTIGEANPDLQVEYKLRGIKDTYKNIGPDNIIGRIKELGGIKFSKDYNTKLLKQNADMNRVLNNKNGRSVDVMADILQGEGYPINSGDDLIELLKAGKGRTIYNPEKADRLYNRDITRQENEWIERKLAEIEQKEGVVRGSTKGSAGSHQGSITDEIRQEGFIKAGSEDEALKEISAFFDEMAGKVKKKVSTSNRNSELVKPPTLNAK